MVVTGTVVLKKRNTKQNAQISDDPTAKKLSCSTNEKEKRDNKRGGVLRRIGLALKVEKENSEVGSTLKKKKKNRPSVRATMRKRTPYVMDTKVHFALTKSHANIPLKGEEISAGQKQVFHKFATELVKKGPYELSMEFMSKVKTYIGQPMKREIFDANPTKNRYKDVICNDVTRVAILDGKEDSLGDYIHANYVNGLNSPFILTQGPLERTTVDFWRMVMYTKACYIVMLCETNEDGKPKCNQYWPDKPGDVSKYGDFTITCKTEEDKDEHIIKAVLNVKNGDKEHSLRHLHTKSWPDKSVPNSTLSLLRMLHIVRTSPGPVVVHCSAGIGRTGTFVAVEACLQILADEKELDLIACLKALRNGRLGSVQVDIQYMTLVQILLNFGKDNGYWDDSDLDDRVELLTWNISQFITTRGKPHVDPPPKKDKVNNKDYSDDDDKEEKVQATQYMGVGAQQDAPPNDKTVCLATPVQSEAEAAPPPPPAPAPAPHTMVKPVQTGCATAVAAHSLENSKDKETHLIASKEATGNGRTMIGTSIPKNKIEQSHYIG